MDGKHTNTPAQLLERLRTDGGRYLLSIALTPEESRAQPEPTYGGKGHSRWLTEEEHAALCAALSQRDALRELLRQFIAIMDSAEDGGDGVFEERLERLLPEARALSTNATDGGVGK
jgi:hypothetical protein